MPGAHTGLVRIGQNGGVPLLTLMPSATPVASPFAAYGTIGVNDTGPVLFEAIGFTKAKFQLIGAGAPLAGYEVSVYTTISPQILNSVGPNAPFTTAGATTYSAVGQIDWQKAHGNTSIIPASDWSLVDGPSAQSTTGSVANPMVSGVAWLLEVSSGPYVAFRLVLTAIDGTPANNCQAIGFLTC